VEGGPAVGVGDVGAGATVEQPVGLLHTAPLDEMVEQRFALGGGAVRVEVVREGVGVPGGGGEGAVWVGAMLQEDFLDCGATGAGGEVDGRDGVVACLGFGVWVGSGLGQLCHGG
jgi:hypothetical protein